MATPCIPNPYAALACYALGNRNRVTDAEIDEARGKALSLRSKDPPLLQKFLDLYPPQDLIRKITDNQTEEAEGLLRCIWRGDYERALTPKAGPYVHFKGSIYICYGKAKLLQGPEEEVAVIYSNKEGEMFVRPLREWAEIVIWPNGLYRPRFVEEKP